MTAVACSSHRKVVTCKISTQIKKKKFLAPRSPCHTSQPLTFFSQENLRSHDFSIAAYFLNFEKDIKSHALFLPLSILFVRVISTVASKCSLLFPLPQGILWYGKNSLFFLLSGCLDIFQFLDIPSFCHKSLCSCTLLNKCVVTCPKER